MSVHLVYSHFSVLNRLGVIRIFVRISEARIRYRNFSHSFACKFVSAGWSILIMRTSRHSRCWVKLAFRLRCLYRRYSVFYNLGILSIVTRYDLGIMYYDLGIMYYLSKILLRILPWVPRSPRCSKNLVRSYFTKTAKMLVRGSTQVKLKISRINWGKFINM